MNVQVLAAPNGTPLWFSRALPGRIHDLTAARTHGVIENCLTRQLLVLADRAYQGAGATVRTPYYHHHELPGDHAYGCFAASFWNCATSVTQHRRPHQIPRGPALTR